MSKNQHPLHLPEILILIACTLGQDDLTACIRVSRLWYAAFEPYLYTAVPLGVESFSVSPHPPPAQAVSQYIGRIHTLKVNNLPALKSLLAQTAAQVRLVELSIPSYSTEVVSQLLMSSAQTLRSLTCLHLTTPQEHSILRTTQTTTWETAQASDFWMIVATMLVHLEHLHVCNGNVQGNDVAHFHTICTRLSSLSLHQGVFRGIRPPTLVRMKRLELKMVGTDDMQGQYRLVLQCPNLEHLAWTPTLAITYQLLLFHLVTLSDEQTPCRIVSVDLTGTDVSDGELASLLNCLHKLQRLIVPWSSFGEKSCQQVVWFLRDTLEELDMRSCSALTTGMIQLVLMTCGKLKRLKAQSFCASILEKRTQDLDNLSNEVRIPLDDFNNDGYDGGMTLQLLASLNDSDQFQTSPAILDSIHSWTWACTGLEELELDVHGLGSSSDTILATFLTQLSALISLQRLVLSWSSSESHAHEASLDLTLRGGGGGLAKLKTLTRLRHYDVQNVNLLRMDVDDFRWIGTHWTSLRTVRTAWVDYEDVETKSKIQHLLRTEFPHVALLY